MDRPDEIDIEAIAWDCGAKVRSRKLHDCEARIVGLGDRAIISVDTDVSPRRRRFSIAHELGHWRFHRARCLVCRADQIGNPRASALDPERVADAYASDLLLPQYLLDPILAQARRPTLKVVRDVADAFDVSMTATLIKMVQSDAWPMLIVCHGEGGRRWFSASQSVPPHWRYPRSDLDPESYATGLLSGVEVEQLHPRRIGADAWFDRRGAENYELTEQSFALPGCEILTILHLCDGAMIED